MHRRRRTSALAAALAIAAALPVSAQDEPADAGTEEPVQLTAAEMFALGDAARDRADYETAETVYRALMQDPNPELRTEARFRLGKMYTDQLGRHRDAAVLFREILDEKPDAAAVRLELARMQAMLGNVAEARRELRAAQASGLPPEVEQMVRFYANALTAQKRTGGSFEVAIAPSTNINSATSSDTLGTIIGDFILDEDAQAKSGVGLSLQGQAYHRVPLSAKADVL
ncbi:MAG TPA: tetratricopeptide repeat protein, partial [Alteraurantiacibacter sp.]